MHHETRFTSFCSVTLLQLGQVKPFLVFSLECQFATKFCLELQVMFTKRLIRKVGRQSLVFFFRGMWMAFLLLLGVFCESFRKSVVSTNAVKQNLHDFGGPRVVSFSESCSLSTKCIVEPMLHVFDWSSIQTDRIVAKLSIQRVFVK